jgi:putative DNA primase/helicase
MATDIGTIQAALGCISADLPRDEWVILGMALKSELGEAGIDLFDEWSARGESYKPADCKSTWRSFREGGATTIATLFHMAKAYGYVADKFEPMRPPTPDELHAKRVAREAREREDAATQAAAHAAAAEKARGIWNEANERGASEYLRRKNVKPYGVRFGKDGALIVPLQNETGQIVNLQFIAGQKPTDGSTDKKFLAGARKRGCYHLFGELKGARALLVSEGYATAASLHEACNLPLAVAFDAGNLIHVARALRAAHPQVQIVIAGDDDGVAHGDTKNPGKAGAEAAAKSVGGVWVLPPRDHLPNGGSDFNDMHLHAGLDAVRTVIEGAISGMRKATTNKKRGDKLTPRADSDLKASNAPSEKNATEKPDAFELLDDGVYFSGDGRKPRKICAPLEVIAKTSDATGNACGNLIRYRHQRGHWCETVLSASLLAGDGTALRSELMSKGLHLELDPLAKAKIAEYINSRRTEVHAKTVTRLGWHGDVYVLPKSTIGTPDERIIFQNAESDESHFSQKGSLDNWHKEIGRFCVGNSRLVFAASSAFAAFLLRFSGEGSGGFHFRGDSSSGKTTVARVASSVLGSPAYMQRWRGTDNGLETAAARHSDALFVLDELAQLDARVAGEAAYMLTNEQGKLRATQSGTQRPTLTWKTLILSTGEINLAAHMQEAGKRAKAGQEIRLIDLPADAGANFGVFDTLHGEADGAALSHQLQRACERTYGTSGHAFLDWAVANAPTLAHRVRTRIRELAESWVKAGGSGQVSRAAQRFALVAVGGELAIEAGAVQWPKGEPAWAVKSLFEAWIAARGGYENLERYQLFNQIKSFFEKHGSSRFEFEARAEDPHAGKTMLRAGYKIEDGSYVVFIDTFRNEICTGYDYKSGAAMLDDAGLLTRDGKHFTTKVRIKGLNERVTCYRISSEVHSWEYGNE